MTTMHQYHPPARRALNMHGESSFSLGLAEDAARFSLRIDPRHLDAASQAFGLALPQAIGGMASSSGRSAVCLGPDEWYLVAPAPEEESIDQRFSALYATVPHSLVAIGHRETGIVISGAGAAFALQSAIAFDVEAMPVGSGCRTIIDKAQIILLREAQDSFRIEVWRSFADHVWHLLQTVGREIEHGL